MALSGEEVSKYKQRDFIYRGVRGFSSPLCCSLVASVCVFSSLLFSCLLRLFQLLFVPLPFFQHIALLSLLFVAFFFILSVYHFYLPAPFLFSSTRANFLLFLHFSFHRVFFFLSSDYRPLIPRLSLLLLLSSSAPQTFFSFA